MSYCLNELGDNSLLEEIQDSLRWGTLSDKELEPHQCSALTYVLLMSEERMDAIDLKSYNTSAARSTAADTCPEERQECQASTAAWDEDIVLP